MEFTHELVTTLRRKLGDELAFEGEEFQASALAAFDRSVLAVVLNGSTAATNPFSERAKKAAASRKRNKLKKEKEAGNAGAASDSKSPQGE